MSYAYTPTECSSKLSFVLFKGYTSLKIFCKNSYIIVGLDALKV